MKIELKQIELTNFKGARHTLLNFHGETFIHGDNAAGKTTIFDAFTWLLFGKDSAGRSDFQIKTLNPDGSVIEKIEHEVAGVLVVDGQEVSLRRVLREKWVKQKGAEETIFSGNETLFFVDDVPLKSGEYSAKINAFIDEKLFKLITSPTAFNLLPWTERRALLVSIAGGVSQNEIIETLEASSDQKQFLLNILAQDKTLADHKKQISAQIKAKKDELKLIPSRIDEVNRVKLQKPQQSFKDIREKIAHLGIELAGKTDISKETDATLKEIADFKILIHEHKTEIEAIESVEKAKAKELTTVDTSESDKLARELKELNEEYTQKTIELNKQEEQTQALRVEWSKANAETFKIDDNAKTCPTCKRDFDAEQIQSSSAELEANFNANKAARIEEINKRGKEGAEAIEKTKLKLEGVKARVAEVTEKLKAFGSPKAKETEPEAFQRLLNANNNRRALLVSITTLKDEIKRLESTLGKNDTNKDTAAQALRLQIDALKNELAIEDTIKKADERVKELERQEQELAQSIASIERTQFLLDKYNRASIESTERKINGLFKLVKFKMFEQQINGGESETCVCTVDGVSFSDLNTASQINAGLDIINTLSKHFAAFAPVFIDGRESVVKLIENSAQIINLVVSENDKTLRIENK